nr:hypothetical protein [Tanacetum cinerariifolium]
MSADVAWSYDGDGGGKGKQKPNLGGRAAGGLNTRNKTQNLSLKEITDTKGPVPIQFELRDKQTVMPLGDHTAHWSSYIGEVIRGVPLYYPSWLKFPKERKAALITDIGTQFDLRPHIESFDWTEINADIQQHLQKAYNTNKAAFKARHWVIDPTTGTYNVEKIRRERPENVTASEWDKYIEFWNYPRKIAQATQNRQNQAKSTVISRQGFRSLARLQDEMTSTTQEYLSLIDTFFMAHTVNGEFLRDEDRRIYEMKRLEAMGTYTDDEINRLARRDKQRGHIVGVGRVLPARATASPRVAGAGTRKRVPTIRMTRMRKVMAILSCVIYGDYFWGRNPLRAFPNDYSPATSHQGKSSPATSRKGKPRIVAGESLELTLDVQRMCRYVIVVHYNDDRHIKGSSTPLRYSPRASTPQSYSLRTSRNAECSNCKHLLDKITILEATVDMYMHSEQHTVNSAALFHEVYSNIGKLDLEYGRNNGIVIKENMNPSTMITGSDSEKSENELIDLRKRKTEAKKAHKTSKLQTFPVNEGTSTCNSRYNKVYGVGDSEIVMDHEEFMDDLMRKLSDEGDGMTDPFKIVGEKFMDVDQLKECPTYYTLANGFSLWFNRSKNKRLIAKSGSRLEKLKEPEKGKQMNYKWIGKHFGVKIRLNPEIKLHELAALVMKKYKCIVSPTQCRHAKRRALSKGEATIKDHYAYIRSYGKAILESNHGLTVKVGVTVPDSKTYFDRTCFLSLDIASLRLRNGSSADSEYFLLPPSFDRLYVCFKGLKKAQKVVKKVKVIFHFLQVSIMKIAFPSRQRFSSPMSCLMVRNLIFGSAFVKCVSLLSSLFNHNACVVAAVVAMNYDSHDDSATVACFCILQLIGDSL